MSSLDWLRGVRQYVPREHKKKEYRFKQIVRECEHCKNSFSPKPSNKFQKFCCRECYVEEMKIVRERVLRGED